MAAKHLPNDVSRCDNNKCPLRNECQRFIDNVGSEQVVVSHFEPEDNETCDNLIQTFPTDEF